MVSFVSYKSIITYTTFSIQLVVGKGSENASYITTANEIRYIIAFPSIISICLITNTTLKEIIWSYTHIIYICKMSNIRTTQNTSKQTISMFIKQAKKCFLPL